MKNCLEDMDLNLYYFLISQNISADLKGPKVKYKLNYVCLSQLRLYKY